MRMQVRSEEAPTYAVNKAASKAASKAQEDAIIAQALEILEQRVSKASALSSPEQVFDYLRLRVGTREHEVFGVIWLNVKHQPINVAELFRGTVNSGVVHPREVAKEALAANASGVILFHNHPSGNPEPSAADHQITEKIKNALDLLEVDVVDHVIATASSYCSFRERGYL